MNSTTDMSSERQTALISLGYSSREADFLVSAGLHGGYFLRRQYAEFLGVSDGGTVTQLIEKAIDKGHVEVATYRANTHLYHLAGRPFYAALGQEDNRNRRRKEPLTIKTKLMGLDFVLSHLDREYLTTEKEKRHFFEGALGIAPGDLPAKHYGARGHRYFVEKYPLFLSSMGNVSPHPIACFCFVDPGQTTLSAFETFLTRYAPLLAKLPEHEVIYVAASHRLFEKAKLLFNEFRQSPEHASLCISSGDEQALLEYFKTRNLYETKQLGSFDRDKLIRLRELRQTFSETETELLYKKWKMSDRVFESNGANKSAEGRARSGRFSTYLLEHSYDLFGSLTAY